MSSWIRTDIELSAQAITDRLQNVPKLGYYYTKALRNNRRGVYSSSMYRRCVQVKHKKWFVVEERTPEDGVYLSTKDKSEKKLLVTITKMRAS